MSTPLTPDTGSPPLSYGVQPFPAKDASALEGAHAQQKEAKGQFGAQKQAHKAASAQQAKQHPKPSQQPNWLKHRATVDKLVALFRAGAPADAVQRAEQLLAAPDAGVRFPSGDTMTLLKMVRTIQEQVVPSFPDFALQLVENTYKEDGLVATWRTYAGGTFSGKPFSVLGLPAVAPTAKRVYNGIEPMRLVFDEQGKVARLEVGEAVDGTLAGPLGLYERAGGQLPKSEQHKHIAVAFEAANSAVDPAEALHALFAPGGFVAFDNQPHVSPEQIGHLIAHNLRPAAPDFQLRVLLDTYKEVGRRLTFDVQPTGTHTGPFSLPAAMGGAKPLPATGRKIQDVMGPEHVTAFLDGRGRIEELHIRNSDAYGSGPVRGYVSLGGQLHEAPAARNQRVHRLMYELFKRGQIPAMLKHCAPNVDWRWGDVEINADDGRRNKNLPWYGRWIGEAGIIQGFTLFYEVAETLQFEPTEWFSTADGSQTISVVHAIVRRRARPDRPAYAAILAHHCRWDEQGKLLSFREYSDTAANLDLWDD